jgi:type IV pilus assembly protein PilX
MTDTAIAPSALLLISAIEYFNMVKKHSAKLTEFNQKQFGISLPIVLVFLVVLSLLAIAIIQGSTLGAGIARNESDRNLAFQAAEAALRDAEKDIEYLKFDSTKCAVGASCRPTPLNPSDFNSTCTAGLCDPKSIIGNAWDSAIWGPTDNSVQLGTYTGAVALPLVSRQPRYIIEYFPIGNNDVLRVTATGFGLNSSTQITLQTSIKARL